MASERQPSLQIYFNFKIEQFEPLHTSSLLVKKHPCRSADLMHPVAVEIVLYCWNMHKWKLSNLWKIAHVDSFLNNS